MAKALGDDTAEGQGRLTLNPVAHIDPIGTVILPLALRIWGGLPFFGWAKPVPYNPARFRRGVNVRTGAMLVAAAGPASNLVLAALCIALIAVGQHSGAYLAIPVALRDLVEVMVAINIGLAIFNMIPVYPLDGQKVLVGLLPTASAIEYERFSFRYGSFLLIGVMLLISRTGIVAVPHRIIMQGLATLFGVTL
jgi:Zn-dependent protease